MRNQNATPDLAVASIAARQHGVVSFRQLRSIGLTKSGIVHRVRTGRLHRLHRGVYAVGFAGLTPERRWMAAALACGTGAVVSHRSAAALWGLLPARSGFVDVSISGTGGRGSRAGIRLHRARTLMPDATTRRHGIPVTTPDRTIADLRRTSGRRGGISPEELRRAIRQAGVLGLPLGTEAPPDGTRSELERLFLPLCRQHGLPPPEVNAKIESLEVDFLWRDRRLIVETDGYRYHRGRVAFEEDRERDLRLRALGYDVIRVSYRQVVDRPNEILTVLRASYPDPAAPRR